MCVPAAKKWEPVLYASHVHFSLPYAQMDGRIVSPHTSPPVPSTTDTSVVLHCRVDHYPRYQKACKWGDKTFLHELPNSTVLFIVHLLKWTCVPVHKYSVYTEEQCDSHEAFKRHKAPRQPKENSKDLPRPVQDIEKFVLVGPFRVRCERSYPDGR